MNQTPSKKYSKVTQCRVCLGTNFAQWIDFGLQPLANAFSKSPLELWPKYPLKVMVCKDCGFVFLDSVVDPVVLFSDYLYYSSTSPEFINHFETLAAKETLRGRIASGDTVIDIGSNDGILLKPFKALGAKVIGIEPAADIANLAAKSGVETLPEYFSVELAQRIVKDYAPNPKLVTMTNVFAHVHDLDEVIRGIKVLIGNWGRFMIEVPYLPAMIEQNTFDLIYHEHLSYFTLSTLSRLFQRFDLAILEVEQVPVHGGSIRVYVGALSQESGDTQLLIRKLLAKDKKLTTTLAFKKFPETIEKNGQELEHLLARIKKNKVKNRIVGFGAPAKSSTMMNYYEVGKYIDWIIDDAPAKHNHFTPGTNLLIVPLPRDLSSLADYVVIFAWNFSKSIQLKLRAAGYRGSFIVPFPHAHEIYE